MTETTDEIEREISDLIDEMGTVCSGYELSTVMTVLTYLAADACIQSGLGEDLFLAQFAKSLCETVQNMKDHDNGNRTHH